MHVVVGIFLAEDVEDGKSWLAVGTKEANSCNKEGRGLTSEARCIYTHTHTHTHTLYLCGWCRLDGLVINMGSLFTNTVSALSELAQPILRVI